MIWKIFFVMYVASTPFGPYKVIEQNEEYTSYEECVEKAKTATFGYKLITKEELDRAGFFVCAEQGDIII